MSLLERVQKKTQEERPAAPVKPATPATPAAATPPAAPSTPAEAPRQAPAGRLAQRAAAQSPASASTQQRNPNALPQQYAGIKTKIHSLLLEELDTDLDVKSRDKVTDKVKVLLDDYLTANRVNMAKPDKQRIIDAIINDALGLGPLEALIMDPDISEVMINGYNQVYVERAGKLERSPMTFENEDQLRRVIDRIVSSIGRRVDESSPMVDARLEDGSRVNVIIPPLAINGPTMTIRKFSKDPFGVEDLIAFGSMTEDMATFLRACVRARQNIVVSGGTGSGKTTTLNVMSSFIPEDERIVTIEDAAELQLRQEHVVTLETRPANVEGKGRVAIRDLVINTLRMRPDRIVVGECRGGEALDMLQAMSTGHDGSLTTLHANSPKDAIGRLETMVLMAGTELPSRAIREQIASAVNVIVQQTRLRDGTRKIVNITEVRGLSGDQLDLCDIFVFHQTGLSAEGRVEGFHTATGELPTFMEQLSTSGEGVDPAMFKPAGMRVAS
jgi:pilus assembly protein CpaF